LCAASNQYLKRRLAKRNSTLYESPATAKDQTDCAMHQGVYVEQLLFRSVRKMGTFWSGINGAWNAQWCFNFGDEDLPNAAAIQTIFMERVRQNPAAPDSVAAFANCASFERSLKARLILGHLFTNWAFELNPESNSLGVSIAGQEDFIPNYG